MAITTLSRHYLLASVMLVWAGLAPGQAASQEQSEQCIEPEQPYCIYDSATYGSQETYDACKQRVDTFTKNHEQYVACMKRGFEVEIQTLQSSQQEELNAAVERGNVVVDRFNCMQEKQDDCY